jgi:hypothetical protein
MGHRPDHGGHPGPEGEDSMAQPEHAGQAGQHDPSAGGGAADHQGPAATPQQQRLNLVQAGPTDPAPEGELSRRGPQRRPIQCRPSRRPGRRRPRRPGRRQRDAVLGGQHPAQQQGQLARQDQAQEGRRLRDREHEDQGQGRPASVVGPQPTLASRRQVDAAGPVSTRGQSHVAGVGRKRPSRGPSTSRRPAPRPAPPWHRRRPATAGRRRRRRTAQREPGVTRPLS